ncbi:hypothetical protein O3Q51_14895 [Cryomorphaceae bacterium 1068]|nr:hypothetical protein [Cryomorphaceae bacterium 1068]
MRQFTSILICSFLVLFFFSCEEIFEDDAQNLGEEYFECKINGEPFEGIGIPAQCNKLTFDYFPEPYLDLPAGYMAMGANNCVDTMSFLLTFQGISPEANGMTSLGSLSYADAFRPSLRLTNNTTYDRLLDGSFKIDQFNGRKKHGAGRLTGTFEMRLIDSEKTDTLTITDGRFNFYITQKLH